MNDAMSRFVRRWPFTTFGTAAMLGWWLAERVL